MVILHLYNSLIFVQSLDCDEDKYESYETIETIKPQEVKQLTLLLRPLLVGEVSIKSIKLELVDYLRR